MGSFSVWHWIIVLVLVVPPLFFVFRKPPAGPNRFGHEAGAMEPAEALSSFFRNFVNFKGRASRSEFWFPTAFCIIIAIALKTFDPSEILGDIWFLATLLPQLVINTRRLHDINRSGWHQLLWPFFPVGPIALIVWWCKKPQVS